MPTLEELEARVRELEGQNRALEGKNNELEGKNNELEGKNNELEGKNNELIRDVQPTTLDEYLFACQEHVLSKIVLDTRGYLTTKAPSTSPANKHCPRRLVPWAGFVQTQVDMISIIDRMAPRGSRLFESLNFLRTIGNRVHTRPVQDEAGLVFIQNNCVEEPVRVILSGLTNAQQVRFATTATSLRDPTDGRDTVERDARLRTDQICVYRTAGNQKDIAYVIEYKAPHKLHTSHLEQGLREMSIVDEVVNKPIIPTADPARFRHYAELLSAAAITQTYHYMLEAGLEYGYVTNGDAIVFLKIDWATDPTVLLYHLAQPMREVAVNGDPTYSNAVCQALNFTVLSLQAQPHGNNERIAATRNCETWVVDFGCMLDKITKLEEDAKAQKDGTTGGRKHRRVPSSPEWTPAPIKKTKRLPQRELATDMDRSDRVLRSHGRRDRSPEGGGSGGGTGGFGGWLPGVGGPSNPAADHDAGQAPPGNTRTTSNTSSDTSSRSIRQALRPYCTPLCLLTLVHGRMLDKKCPNASLHRTHPPGEDITAVRKTGLSKHPVSHTQWMALLRAQFEEGLEPGVVVLGQEGACGALFQVTLLQYGYTFVAKGGTGRAVPALEKETAVYQALQPLQGRHIPVCLGAVDLRPLRQIFFYDMDVRIIYLVLLSYGGTRITTPPDAATQSRIVRTVTDVLNEMHTLGVVHADVRLPNVLLNDGAGGQVTLIDFDQAKLLPPPAPPAPATRPAPRSALHALSPNKRRRLLDLDDEQAADSSMLPGSLRAQLAHDLSAARSLFTLDTGRLLWDAWQSVVPQNVPALGKDTTKSKHDDHNHGDVLEILENET